MATRQSNPKKTIVTIPGSASAPVLISASKFCRRYVEIQECPPSGGAVATFTGGNYAPQGLNYTLPDDAYSTNYALIPGSILPLGDNNWKRDGGYGVPAMTDPAGNTNAATPFGKFISATVTATKVEVREWS